MYSFQKISSYRNFQIARARATQIVFSYRNESTSQMENVVQVKKGNKRKFGILAWISVGLTSYLGYKFLIKNNHLSVAYAAVPTDSQKNISGQRAKFNFIADVVSVSGPSVVFIEIKEKKRQDFWTGQPLTVSNGSGFIVDESGLILTNAHVVMAKRNTILSVKLFDGRVFQGFIEDVDPSSDLATVRIKCDNLPAIKLGKSGDLRAGEWVVAMGSPLSLSNTVTAGVVSSVQRPSQELGLKGRNINYIQTDAAITFGNSGGPLVNLDGEAIGINSMKVTPGISFAIPIDYAKEFLRVAAERRKSGHVDQYPVTSRRYMGITMLALTPELLTELRQRSHNIPDHVRSGILVWKVIIGSPAHAGGLLPGDIITNINGKDVKSSQDVYECLKSSKDLSMVVWREDRQTKIVIYPEDSD